MSDPQAWSGQPYLDEMRPGRLETVKLALFATYSVDLSAVAAVLLALIGRNNDKGSGTAVDFADAIDKLRDRVKIIIQRGRIARPIALPRIAGILDQFIVEQPYDERERSWHPKIALVAYTGPKGETRWKLWIGSRNLTRSQDLDAGVLLDGSEKRAKGRVRLPGVGALGGTLARSASREDADDISKQLETIWWDAPDGFRLRGLLNGLDQGVPLPVEPPSGAINGITVISPFLSSDFLKRAGKWGPAESRTLISSMPALADIASLSRTSLTGFSKILAYAAPDVLADESTLALPGGNEPVAEDDVEPAPLALHAKIFCFHSGEKTILRVGSANATERAWSGRNSEIMVELEAGEAFSSGLAFLVGKATPVTIEELAAADLGSVSAADALEESRKVLMASWDPVLRRDGECFSIDARAVPSLAYPDHVLHAGPANGDLLTWPTDAVRLGLGPIPLSLQSAFIQVRISSPDGDLRWMQRVTVDPPLEEQRDLAALASHMGLRAFHDWMRAMLDGDALPVGGGAWDDDAGSRGNRSQGLGYDRLTLEDILTAWARDRKAFGRVDRHFAPYVDALLAHGENLSETERADLNELAQIWAIARTQLAS
jgi:hypothetical protein